MADGRFFVGTLTGFAHPAARVGIAKVHWSAIVRGGRAARDLPQRCHGKPTRLARLAFLSARCQRITVRGRGGFVRSRYIRARGSHHRGNKSRHSGFSPVMSWGSLGRDGAFTADAFVSLFCILAPWMPAAANARRPALVVLPRCALAKCRRGVPPGMAGAPWPRIPCTWLVLASRATRILNCSIQRASNSGRPVAMLGVGSLGGVALFNPSPTLPSSYIFQLEGCIEPGMRDLLFFSLRVAFWRFGRGEGIPVMITYSPRASPSYTRSRPSSPSSGTDRLSYSERAMLMGGACAKAYGWSPKRG